MKKQYSNLAEQEESYTVEQKFIIEIEEEVYNQITYLTKHYANEISAFLEGEITPEKICVKGLLFPKQKVTKSSVDTNEESLITLRKEYGDRCLNIIGHWHSHNTMTSFWSKDDDDFIKEYMEKRELKIFFVSSTQNGIRARVEMRKPLNFMLDNCDITIKNKREEEYKTFLEELLKEKVTEEKRTTIIQQGTIINDETTKEKPEVSINKPAQNVEIKNLNLQEADIIKQEFRQHKITTYYQGKNVSLLFFVGEKIRARRLRDELNNFLEEIIFFALEKEKNKAFEEENYTSYGMEELGEIAEYNGGFGIHEY